MWYTATSASVSVTTNPTIVSITTGDDISIIQEDSGLIFEGESPVQVKRGYIDGSGNKFIELQSPWPYSTKTNQPLVAYPTDASFAEATAELRRVIDEFEIASTIEAQEGTDDTKAMSALKTKQAIDFNVASLNLLTAADAGLDGGETNYTSGNANFNEFTFAQNDVKHGYARVAGQLFFEFELNGSYLAPSSISVTGTFSIIDLSTGSTVLSGITPSLSATSYNKAMILIVTGTFTRGGNYIMYADAGGATIEVGY